MRASYSAPIQSPAGALQAGTAVAVFANGSTANGTQLGTLIALPLYADATSAATLTNPFITTSGDVHFYLPFPLRVDLGVQVPGQAQVLFPDVDVITSGIVPVTVTANYNVSLSDQLVMASAATGNLSLLLPMATAGCSIIVKRTDSSGNSMSVNAQSGQLIENAATPYQLPALARARLYSDGTGWWVI
jgi:hypothetical protein